MTSRALPAWLRPRPVTRRSAIVLHTTAGLAALTALIGLVAHVHAPSVTWELALAAFAPYLMACCVPALAIWTALRQWLPAAGALVLLLLAVASQAPLYTSDSAPSGARRLTVMTANLRLGEGQPASVVDAVRSRKVDLLAVEELTPAALSGLAEAGLDALLPYHETAPAESGLGTGLWSRYRLDARVRYDFTFRMITGRIRVPGLPPIAVAAVHVCGPYPDAACWVRDIRRLPGLLNSLTADRTTIVAGDFNATPDVVQFRALLKHGYVDATEQSGAGWVPTYPADRWFPPVIPIDHVLTRGAVATDVDSVDLANSDHRGLVVHVAVRP